MRALSSSLSGHTQVPYLAPYVTFQGTLFWDAKSICCIVVYTSVAWDQDWELGTDSWTLAILSWLLESRHGLVSLGIGCSWHPWSLLNPRYRLGTICKLEEMLFNLEINIIDWKWTIIPWLDLETVRQLNICEWQILIICVSGQLSTGWPGESVTDIVFARLRAFRVSAGPCDLRASCGTL